MLYSSSFCQKSSVSACQHCLHRAKRTLLHDCNKHVIGAEFYSETCAMRFCCSGFHYNQVIEAAMLRRLSSKLM
ncbi:hypothetical protein LINPERHAP2_LOCUS27310 [Linum perenne]